MPTRHGFSAKFQVLNNKRYLRYHFIWGTMPVGSVIWVIAAVCVGLLSKIECLEIDDGLLKEIIESYNDAVPGPLRVVDFKDIQVPASTYPLTSDSRMKVTAVTGTGRRYKTVLRLREVPSTGFRRELSIKTGIFGTCFNVHSHVIPKLEELQLESEDDSEPLWPIHLASRWQHLIVTTNYPPGRWLEGTPESVSTLEDYALVLRSLAKWHAMTAVLLERRAIPEELFNTSMTVRNQQRTLTYYKYLLKNFAEVVRVSWGDEWSSFAAKTSVLASIVPRRILDVFNHSKSSPDGFRVLNLGDFNLPEMLFSVGISDTFSTSRPIARKFTTFERAHINTPALDVNSVLYTLPSVGLALKNRQTLLTSAYYPSLIRYLAKFGYSAPPPTWAEIQAEIHRTELFGVLECINSLSHVKTNPTGPEFVGGLEKAWKTGEVKVNMTGMLTGEFSSVMKTIMHRVVENDIFT